MDGSESGRLLGSEIHGFHTMQDLDMQTIMEEARTRWLRPNEIHAILCNYKRFTIHVKPMTLPPSGTTVLFDRKVLRNFRKDGHNWKKKKDGKTVKEAHEHLKVGNDERIHVYYAHGQDNPTLVRRCYWLLDKTLEHIVLVHYRDTAQESQGSPVTPVDSNSSSSVEKPTTYLLSEDLDSVTGHRFYSEPGDSLTLKSYEMRLNELNTLDWDELVTNVPDNSTLQKGGQALGMNQQTHIAVNGATVNHSNLGAGGSVDIPANDGLQNQDSFGRWVNYIIADSPDSVDDAVHASSLSSGQNSYTSLVVDHPQLPITEQLFSITDISPQWAFSNETTKVLVTGNFQKQYLHLEKSSLLCVCDDASVPLEFVQTGVYRCLLSCHSPGTVAFYLSLDGHQPISQVLNFEYRNPPILSPVVSLEDKGKWEELQLQLRLAHLLLSTMKTLNVVNTKVPPTAMKDARKFSHKSSLISDGWMNLIKSIEGNRISYAQAKDGLMELTLKNLLKEWLLERIVEGRKVTEYDNQGLGVIHLCAILGYTWAIHLYSWSGLSINFRDKHGWSALHWAAYYGREKMVAVLLSAGANPNWVTDPTTKNPGGCTAADLAQANGYDGLAAYLSEKALVAHFEAMSIAGNVGGSLQSNNAVESVSSENLTEEELNLKETLAAYRTAADAAARIQVAFREHSLKVRTKAVEFDSPEAEARNIVAAMRIQHAFRNYESRKKMAAAARIQYRFRTWKMRKEFLNMRRQAIRIQAAFRGYQARRQYHKIVWSVGVLEKAILRWRLKRKGFRGLQVDSAEEVESNDPDDPLEDFYKTSQKQAEERVERAVVTVQTMFRSKKAQEEYRRMKLAHNVATLEYQVLLESDNEMDG